MATSGTYMKDGGMDRDPHKPSRVATWKHGVAETISKGAPYAKPQSNGMHGLKMDAKKRARMACKETKRGQNTPYGEK